MSRPRLVPVLLLLGALGCDPGRLRSSTGELVVSQEPLDVGTVWLGAPRQAGFELLNGARRGLTVRTSADAPATLPELLELNPGELRRVEVSFEPTGAGPFSGIVRVESELGSAEVPFSGEARAPPECAPRNDCHQSSFDPQQGACVEALLEEGTACGAASTCLEQGTCRAGECVGTPRSCDDGNACTTDVCVEGQGCVQHDSSRQCALPQPEQQCDGGVCLEPCIAGLCDPATGCQTAPVADGTRCGPGDCQSAYVCMSGACVTRPVPEGAACGEDNPCRAAGTCQQGACVQAPEAKLASAWSYTTPSDRRITAFGALDADENLYWVECGGTRCELVSALRSGVARFKVPLAAFTASSTPSFLWVSGARVGIATDEGELSVHRTSDGAQLFGEALLPLVKDDVQPTSGTAQQLSAYLGGQASDGAGRSYLVLAVDAVSSGGGQRLASYLLAIDEGSGALVWKRRAVRHSSPVIDSPGRLFIGEWADDHAPGRLLALDRAGQEAWQLAGAATYPLAAHAGRVLSYGAIFSVHSSTWALPPSGLGMLPLVRGSSIWSVTGEDVDCFPTAPVLERIDATTGGLIWKRNLLDPRVEEAWARIQPVLTERNRVLLARGSGLGSVLQEFDPSGQERFTCKLEGPHSPMRISLGAGRAYLQSLENCPTCLRGGVARIDAFDLPGRVPASSGWTGPGGSPGNTRSAR